MRTIKEIIIHCSDTPEWRDDRAANIRRWHKARGFDDIGYHYIIDLDGTIEPGREIEKAGAHAQGHNTNSIGICYIGGADSNMKPKDTRTDAQKSSLLLLLKYLRSKYPAARIIGHRDVSAKPCPCFDAKTEYKDI